MTTPTEPNPNPSRDQHGILPAPTVWHAPAPPEPHTLTAPLARQILNHLTQPGDIVVDVDNDGGFAAVATETGRRHHSLGGHAQLMTVGRVAGHVDLVLLHWPQPSANPRFLLAACRALLRPAGRPTAARPVLGNAAISPGSLVIAVAVPAADRIKTLSALTGAARTAELQHVRHIAVTDDADNPRDATGPARGDHRPPGTPHTDLLILTPRAGRHA
jgi:hypothetical protein